MLCPSCPAAQLAAVSRSMLCPPLPFHCSQVPRRLRCRFLRPLAAFLCLVRRFGLTRTSQPQPSMIVWHLFTGAPSNFGGGFRHLGAWPAHSVGVFGTATLKSLHGHYRIGLNRAETARNHLSKIFTCDDRPPLTPVS